MDAGRVVAGGTSDELKPVIGGDLVEVVVRAAADLGRVAAVLERVTGGAPETDPDARHVPAAAVDRVTVLTEVVRALDHARIPVSCDFSGTGPGVSLGR